MCKECGHNLFTIAVEVSCQASIVDGELRPFENLLYGDEGKVLDVRCQKCGAKADMDGMTVKW